MSYRKEGYTPAIPDRVSGGRMGEAIVKNALESKWQSMFEEHSYGW